MFGQWTGVRVAGSFGTMVGSQQARLVYPRVERTPMTSPRAPQWPLAPALRLTALAMVFVAGAWLTEGWVRTVLLICGAVIAVLAATKLVAGWRTRR